MPAHSPISHAEESKPRGILVVEDEVLVRLTVSEFLRDCGFQVFEAADGEEAVKVLTASTAPIDLVFSDIQMPRLDGFGLACWIRENRPHVKVILTSGNPASVAAKASDLCEQGPIVSKPYDHARLRQTIERMLSKANTATT
jgi:CheY-like chemotaxis protein